MVPVPMLKEPAEGALNAGAKLDPNAGAGAFAPPKFGAGLDPNAGVAPEKLKLPLFGASPAVKENDDGFAGAALAPPKVNVDAAGLLAPKVAVLGCAAVLPKMFDDPAPKAGVVLAPLPNAPVCGVALKLPPVPLLLPKVEELAELPNPKVLLLASATLPVLPPNGTAALLPNPPVKFAFVSDFCAAVPELNVVPNIFGGSCFGAEKVDPKAGGGLLVLPKAGELVPKAVDDAANVEFVLVPPNDGVAVPKVLEVAVPNVGFAVAPNGKDDVVVVPGTNIIGYL